MTRTQRFLYFVGVVTVFNYFRPLTRALQKFTVDAVHAKSQELAREAVLRHPDS